MIFLIYGYWKTHPTHSHTCHWKVAGLTFNLKNKTRWLFSASSAAQIRWWLLLPAANRRHHMPVQSKLWQQWALSHTPARVVYFSAAATAAVEDPGICVGKGGGPLGATLCSSSEPTVFSLHVHNAEKGCLFTLHVCAWYVHTVHTRCSRDGFSCCHAAR